jgi:predicted DNA binding protein
MALDISVSAYRDRLFAAERKIAAAIRGAA